MLQTSSAGKVVADSVDALLSAFGGGGRVAGPAANAVTVHIDEGYYEGTQGQRGGHSPRFQSCRDCLDIFAAVAFNRTVTELKMEWAPEEVCMAVAKALKHNSTVETFVITYSCMARPEMGNETFLAMADAAGSRATLEARVSSESCESSVLPSRVLMWRHWSMGLLHPWARPAPDSTASKDAEKEQGLGRAPDESLAEADRGSEDVVPALLNSKVVWRLTNHSEEIAKAILTSDALAECRGRVERAGCKVMPEWANRAILLVPVAAEQVMVAVDGSPTGSRGSLKHYNLVALESDYELVVKAVSRVPRNRRPMVKREHRLGIASGKQIALGAHEESGDVGSSRPQPDQADGTAACSGG